MSKAKLHTGFLPDGCLSEGMMLAYLEDHLPDKERHLAERHMQSCDLCVDALEGMSVLSAARRPHLVSETKAQVKKKIFPTENIGRYLSIAASVTVVFFSFFFLYTFLFKNAAHKETSQTTMPPAENSAVLPEVKKEEIAADQIAADTVAPSIALNQDEVKNLPNNKPYVASDAIITNERSSSLRSDVSALKVEEELTEPSTEDLMYSNQSGAGDLSKMDIARDENISNSSNKDVMPISKKIELSDTKNKASKGEFKEEIPSYYQEHSHKKSNSSKKYKKSRSESSKSYAPSMSMDDNELKRAISIGDVKENYQAKKYEETILSIAEYKGVHGETEESNFYEGMSNYQLKHYDKSIASLEKISPIFKDYEEAQFTIAKCYLANGKVEKGNEILKMIVEGKGKFSEEAKGLFGN